MGMTAGNSIHDLLYDTRREFCMFNPDTFAFAIHTVVNASQSITTCEDVTIDVISKDDPATYDFLCSGSNPHAIPYFSDEIMALLHQFQPQNNKQLQTAFARFSPKTGDDIDWKEAGDFTRLFYRLAWLYVHYPAHLRAGALTASFGSPDKLQAEIWVCREAGISVHAPSINKSEAICIPTGESSIRMGFEAITGISSAIAEHIVASRARYKTELEPAESDRPWVFIAFEEFLHAIDLDVVQADDIKKLIRGGAFEPLLVNPLAAYEAIDDMVSELNACGKISTPANDIINLNQWSPKQLLAHEYDLIGAYIRSHPLSRHIPRFADNIAKIKKATEASYHTLLARVVSVEVRHVLSQSKETYSATMVVDDPHGRLVVNVHSYSYHGLKECLVPNNLLLLQLIARMDDNKSAVRFELVNATTFRQKLPDGLTKGDFNFHHIRYLTEKQYAESILKKVVDSIKAIDRPDAIHISSPMDDHDVNNFLWHSLDNPFELCNTISNEIVRKTRPNTFDLLINAIAVDTEFFHENGVANAYADCIQGRAKPSYLIPELKPLLGSSYGFILFREQFYTVVETLAGYSHSEAQDFHRVLTRKSIEELIAARKQFLKAVSNSMTEDEASNLFDWLEKWAACVRRREHLIEPVSLCYRLACIRLHHPEFFTIATEIVDRETAI